MEIDDDGQPSLWESCPSEILLLIFEYVDAKDLLACMGVSTLWRSNANYMGKKSGKWLQLLQSNVENKAFNFLQRTILDYRELYLNCRMWYSVRNAEARLKRMYNLKEVQNLHIYRDSLIATLKNVVKIYKLDSGNLIREIPEPCFDYQETDFMIAKFLYYDGKKHISLYSKQNDETYESIGFRLCNVQHNKCHLTNWKNGVDFFESTPNGFVLRRLGRYYSSPRLLCALHMYGDDMYIYTSKGDVYHRRNGELGINRVCTLDVPNPPEYPSATFKTMFHNCSVVYAVEGKEKEGLIKNLDVHGKEHLVLLYADLSCAVPHDDILVLGFEDGKVGIVVVKNLWKTYDITPVYEFYIQEVVPKKKKEPITNLEVYEGDGCHHLFVATKSNLYQVVIYHADYQKVLP